MGVLTGVLAVAYLLGFLGVGGACQKSPMISRRKVDIIPFLSDAKRPILQHVCKENDPLPNESRV